MPFIQDGHFVWGLLWCYFLYKRWKRLLPSILLLISTGVQILSQPWIRRKRTLTSRQRILFYLDCFNEHMEQELYAENICFILNKLMPVVYNAAVIGVTRESNDAIGKFKRNLIRKHCREFRPMEVLYELNLFYPFLCFWIGGFTDITYCINTLIWSNCIIRYGEGCTAESSCVMNIIPLGW